MVDAAADPFQDNWKAPPGVPDTPNLHLDGFDGPLGLLLDLAERARIDLCRIPVSSLIDQFVAAMARHEHQVPLERRGDWLVLAARLLLLRSQLLLPGTPKASAAARDDAERALGRLQALQFIRAAVAWLEARPQLGRDVFARPPKERDPRVASYMWLMEACLAVLEREEGLAPADAELVYRPVVGEVFRVAEALARIRVILAGLTAPMKLTGLLPLRPEAVDDRELIARSAVASTFAAVLELARTAEMVLGEGEEFDELSAAPLRQKSDSRQTAGSS